MIEELEEAISNYYSMIDYSDKEELSYIRKAITKLKRELKTIRKGEISNLN